MTVHSLCGESFEDVGKGGVGVNCEKKHIFSRTPYNSIEFKIILNVIKIMISLNNNLGDVGSE